MTTPRYDTHWEVSGYHPDKREPFDLYINFFPTEARALEVKEELIRQGYEHINIVPPRNPNPGPPVTLSSYLKR